MLLFKVCIVANVLQCARALESFEPEINRLVFLVVPANSSHCTRASDFRRKVRHQSGSSHDL